MRGLARSFKYPFYRITNIKRYNGLQFNSFSRLQDSRTHTTSVYDLDTRKVLSLHNYQDIKAVVEQLDEIPTLSSTDVQTLLIPLSHVCGKLKNNQQIPTLLQKIIFQCLKRIPYDLAERQQKQDLPYPSAELYTRAIIAWGSLNSAEGARNAERIFQLQLDQYEMERQYADSNPAFQIRAHPPARATYKSTIRAWALSGDSQAPEKAWSLIHEMETKSDIHSILTGQGTGDMPSIDRPDLACYNLVLRALATAEVSSYKNIEMAKQILYKLDCLEQKLGPHSEYEPDHFTFRETFRTYGNYVGARRKSMGPQVSEEILSLLRQIHQRDEIAKHQKSSDSLMKKLNLADSYARYIEALLKTHPHEQNVQKAYEVALQLAGRLPCSEFTANAYSWPRQDSLTRIVRSLESSSLKDGDRMISELLDIAVHTPFPYSGRLTQGMHTWSRSECLHAPEVVEGMLLHNLSTPDLRNKLTGEHFAVTLACWWGSRRDDAAERAEDIFKLLLDTFEKTKDPNLRPQDIHLHYLFMCWLALCSTSKRYYGLSGNLFPAEHIENLLLLLFEYDRIENPIGSFATAIRAWAMQEIDNDQDAPNAVQRAAALLHTLERNGIKMTAYPVNWSLEVCRRTQKLSTRRDEAFAVAKDIFDSYPRNGRSYELMCDIVKERMAHLESRQHATQYIQNIFLEACDESFLSQHLVWHITAISSAAELQKLLGIPYHYAESIVDAREEHLHYDGRFFRWNGKVPNRLLLKALPVEWSEKVEQSPKSRNISTKGN